MCDCDMPAFYREEVVKARKPHKCKECGETIQPGQFYDRATGCWDGTVSTIKTCAECAQLIHFLRTKFKGEEEIECLCHGELFQALYHLDLIPNDDELYADEPEDLKIFAHCTIVSSVPWLVRKGRAWRLVEVEQLKVA